VIAMKQKISTILTILLLSALILQIMPPVIAQTNTTNVRVHLSGPSVLGTLKSGEYVATITDPESRSWNYKVYITANNLTGASPLSSSPTNGSVESGNNTFNFNITSMQKAGELKIHINCTSGTLYYEKIQPITVVTPIIFNVEINNPSNVVVKNATVQFLVDGVEIDRETISSLEARQSTTVSSEWIATDKEPGWHDSSILVDLNGDGIIDKDVGDMIIEDRFFIEGGKDWVFAVTVLIGLTALVLGFGLISRRKMR